MTISIRLTQSRPTSLTSIEIVFFKTPVYLQSVQNTMGKNGVVHRQGRGRREVSSDLLYSVGAVPGEVIGEDLQTEP
jgi:hypothetical protein